MKIKYTLFMFVVSLLIACNQNESNNAKELGSRESSKPLPPLEALKARTLQDLVFVEGGTFMQGDIGYTDENGRHRNYSNRLARPTHPVKLSSYSIQRYEVTFADFDLYSKESGTPLIDEDRRHREHKGPTYPVRNVLWQEARDYCNWLGELIDKPMDLPTEAQWEYAARSRGKAVGHATNNGDIEYGVNYRDPRVNTFGDPVGSWPPNPLGLYDMSGNAMEWTLDNFHVYKASDTPLVDPAYIEEDKLSPVRVTRGSGVAGGKGVIALYNRYTKNPKKRNANTGFRCVANVKAPIQP